MGWFDFGPQHGHRLRLGLGFAVLLALVTGLFMRADEVSPEEHYAYMQSLRRIQQADVELNAAAVASYADLLQNYDPLLRHVQAIRSEQSQLTRIPSSLSTISQARLRRWSANCSPASRQKKTILTASSAVTPFCAIRSFTCRMRQKRC